MDIPRDVQSQKRLLQDTKVKLEREIDTLHKEIDHVEQDSLGVMNKVKMLIATQVARTEDGMETIMGGAYSRAKRGGFENARDYIEHLKQASDEARGAISKVNEIIANLDSIERDQSALDSRLDAWTQKTKDLLT